jgi:hypothetical protein
MPLSPPVEFKGVCILKFCKFIIVAGRAIVGVEVGEL